MTGMADELVMSFTKKHFRVRTSVQLGTSQVSFMASKVFFMPVGFALLSTHVVALEKDEAKPGDIDIIFEIGFELAKRFNRIPLLRGMQFGYEIMPLIIGKNPHEETAMYAVSAPTMPKFGVQNFPIVIDVETCRPAFFEGFKMRGASFTLIAQKVVTKAIEPAMDKLSTNSK